MSKKLEVTATIHKPIDQVWEIWTQPQHIIQWNAANEDWHTPSAENDLQEGGTFNFRMEARDKSFGFDFAGTYLTVIPLEYIKYELGDGRQVEITFIKEDDKTTIIEQFDPEDQNSLDLQQQGWQMILNNFAKYSQSF